MRRQVLVLICGQCRCTERYLGRRGQASEGPERAAKSQTSGDWFSKAAMRLSGIHEGRVINIWHTSTPEIKHGILANMCIPWEARKSASFKFVNKVGPYCRVRETMESRL